MKTMSVKTRAERLAARIRKNRVRGGRTGGFTLVELIVVIAILAILAGVGTVAYSGYVKKANKTVDQQLVADIKYAVELAYISDPSFNGTEAIVLRQGQPAEIVSTVAVGETPWLNTAISNAFGADALDGMQLKYSDWGRGAAVAQETLSYFSTIADTNPLYAVVNGTATPSFANDVDDLFTLIRDTAILVNGGLEGTSGAELIQNAADLTAGTGAVSASTFANAWANSVWSSDILMGEGNGSNYNENAGSLTGDLLSSAVANAGVIKARNTSLACYLRDNDCPELYDLFADYHYGSTIIPMDAVGILLADDTGDPSVTAQKNELIMQMLGTGADLDIALSALYSYYGLDEDGEPVGSRTDTQAYKDGLAYYTMMSTINAVNNDSEAAASDDAYWDEMAGAVSLYGSIARGETTLEQLNDVYNNLGAYVGEENAVVITVMAANGAMAVNVSPSAALPG